MAFLGAEEEASMSTVARLDTGYLATMEVLKLQPDPLRPRCVI